MKDVTAEMARFRIAACDIWNKFLFPGEGIYDQVIEDGLDAIEREMLKCSVFRDVTHFAEMYRKKPLTNLLVRANSEMMDGTHCYVGQKDDRGNFKWEELCSTELDAGELYELFDLFDFNHYSTISYQFARVVSKQGAVRLIPTDACKFLLDDGAVTSDG